MRKKRIRVSTYEQVIGRYGNKINNRILSRKPSEKIVYAKSFNNGEIPVPKKQEEDFIEYVVQKSISDSDFEEYVVQKSISEPGTSFEIAQGLSDNEVNAEQEYKLDLFNPPDKENFISPYSTPYVETKSINQNISEKTERPQTNSRDTSETPVNSNSSEDDLNADLEAILRGEKIYDPATKKTIDKNQASTPAAQAVNNTPNTPAPLPDTTSEHAIFDRIAQSMQYANAYDLGSVDIEKRFSEFDRVDDFEKKIEKKIRPAEPVVAPANNQTNTGEITTAQFIEDLDSINRNQKAPATNQVSYSKSDPDPDPTRTAEWPVRPTNIRPYRLPEKKIEFGEFSFEPDPSTEGGDGIRILGDWKRNNIRSVSIPQLEGIIRGQYPDGKRIAKDRGEIEFHVKGEQKLKDLWKAWEDAGLLNLVVTFSAGFIPRYVRSKDKTKPRSLSNHAWGTAFDINVQWNRRGDVPALKGTLGSTRELVEIANAHGFFWGGHFPGASIDGMHFELGKIIS